MYRRHQIFNQYKSELHQEKILHSQNIQKIHSRKIENMCLTVHGIYNTTFNLFTFFKLNRFYIE